jgi:hypothetical protein
MKCPDDLSLVNCFRFNDPNTGGVPLVCSTLNSIFMKFAYESKLQKIVDLELKFGCLRDTLLALEWTD